MEAVDDGVCWIGSDSSLLVCRYQLYPRFRMRWVAFAIIPYPPFGGGGDRRSFMDAFPPLLLRSLVCGLFV